MDKSLEDLKRVAKMLDNQKKIQDGKNEIQDGKNEPIEEIRNIRTRKDSLESSLAELMREEKELNLRLKILKKKEDLEKIHEKLELKLEEERFYEEKKDAEGYTQLRDDKWARDFDELILKLKQVEDAEANQTIDVETANEQKELLTNEIKRLVSIKNKNKAKNRLNKIGRGLKKVTKGIGSFSKEMGKFGDSVGGQGKVGGSGGFDSRTWENFFNDKPSSTSSPSKPRKRRRTKRTKKGKKAKKGKKRRKSKKKQTQSTEQSPNPRPQSNDMFGGF